MNTNNGSANRDHCTPSVGCSIGSATSDATAGNALAAARVLAGLHSSCVDASGQVPLTSTSTAEVNAVARAQRVLGVSSTAFHAAMKQDGMRVPLKSNGRHGVGMDGTMQVGGAWRILQVCAEEMGDTQWGFLDIGAADGRMLLLARLGSGAAEVLGVEVHEGVVEARCANGVSRLSGLAQAAGALRDGVARVVGDIFTNAYTLRFGVDAGRLAPSAFSMPHNPDLPVACFMFGEGIPGPDLQRICENLNNAPRVQLLVMCPSKAKGCRFGGARIEKTLKDLMPCFRQLDRTERVSQSHSGDTKQLLVLKRWTQDVKSARAAYVLAEGLGESEVARPSVRHGRLAPQQAAPPPVTTGPRAPRQRCHHVSPLDANHVKSSSAHKNPSPAYPQSRSSLEKYRHVPEEVLKALVSMLSAGRYLSACRLLRAYQITFSDFRTMMSQRRSR